MGDIKTAPGGGGAAETKQQQQHVPHKGWGTKTNCPRCFGHGCWLIPPGQFNPELGAIYRVDTFMLCPACSPGGPAPPGGPKTS